MQIFRIVRELKALGADLKSGAEPRKNSLHGPEVELAVKAAQEDVCANIDLAITVLLIATGCHPLVCFTAACWTVAQSAEAVKWELLLRLERVKLMKGIK